MAKLEVKIDGDIIRYIYGKVVSQHTNQFLKKDGTSYKFILSLIIGDKGSIHQGYWFITYQSESLNKVADKKGKSGMFEFLKKDHFHPWVYFLSSEAQEGAFYSYKESLKEVMSKIDPEDYVVTA